MLRLVLVALVLFTMNDASANASVKLLPAVEETIHDLVDDFDAIGDERRADLRLLSEFVRSKMDAGEPALLTFICTHNSRRSHMSQIWARTAAAYYGVPGVTTYSGGTEATAFNPRAVAALERAGFEIEARSDDANPVYEVRYAEAATPIEAFSKVYDQEPNPKRDFAAVMTCSSADQACPFVPGAAVRVAIPFEDPKAFDGTKRETRAYDERCRQIATEMLYVFSVASQDLERGTR